MFAKRRQTIKTLIASIRLVKQYDKKYFYFTFLNAIIEGTIHPILLLFMQKIINMVQTRSVNISYIVGFLVIYFFLQILSNLLSSLLTIYLTKFQNNFSKMLEIRVFKVMEKMKMEDFDNPETYDDFQRTQSQKGEDIIAFFSSFVVIIKEIINSIGMLIILINFNVAIVLLIILVPILQFFVTNKISGYQYNIIMGRTMQERNLWYIDFLFSTGSAFKEMKLFQYGSYLIQKYEKIKLEIIQQDINIEKRYVWVNWLMSTIDMVITFGIYVFIIIRTFASSMLIGDMTTYIQSIESIKGSVGIMLMSASSLIQKSYYVKLLLDFLEHEKNLEDENSKKTINAIKTIEFKNVSYKYKNCHDYVLKDVTFLIHTGEIIGLVGPNGSGKSTLLKILMGFYEDYEGQVLINSIDLREINQEIYQGNISAVFQDYVKYEFSILENITISNIANADDVERVKKILKRVGLSYKSMEKNLNTVVGKWFGDVELSIGEWQKLAIARSLFRKVDLLILDEADASLDAIVEKQIMSLIREVFGKGIGIFVSHNVKHVSKVATCIYVLNNGKLVENGSHDDLLRKEGLYFQMYHDSC